MDIRKKALGKAVKDSKVPEDLMDGFLKNTMAKGKASLARDKAAKRKGSTSGTPNKTTKGSVY